MQSLKHYNANVIKLEIEKYTEMGVYTCLTFLFWKLGDYSIYKKKGV